AEAVISHSGLSESTRTPQERAISTVRSVEAESTMTISAPPISSAASSTERKHRAICTSSFLLMITMDSEFISRWSVVGGQLSVASQRLFATVHRQLTTDN